MNAFELLKADHKKVAELFDRLEAASGKAKLNIFKQIKDELELHTHVEEKIFYPALEKPEETHDLTLEAYEEHKVVKTLLTELAAAKSANDEWQAKAKVLRENVEHHVEEEEKELFDKADDVLSDEEIEAIGEQMEAEKARKQGRPVPKKSAAKKAQPVESGKRGILSRIANFIGLETEPKARKATASKKVSGKTGARASATAAKTSKKGTTKTNKRGAAKASKKVSAKKSSGATARKSSAASKRTSASQGFKRVPGSRSSGASKSSPSAGSAKKAAKKRTNRK